ncbi:MAG: hypothetical protein IPH84_20435 [Bacteroidales bacterium]|nr:hypothetical protein [Bacteroidales bacterium]
MKIFYLSLIMLIFSGSLVYGQAAKSGNTAKPANTTNQSYTPGTFVDKDNNGTCDNYENRGGRGRGANFVDADGDGVCDRRSGNGYRQGNRGKNAVQGCRRGGNTPNRGGRCR